MKILAIDGNSLINRAFYGVGPLNAPDGTPTNALYGFINIVNRLAADEKPDGLCVMQDLPAPTFRHGMYDRYKAGRRAMPDELAAQIPLYNEYLDLCHIPRFAAEGFEADDLLGSFGRLCAQNGHQCLIVTGDRDAFQLVSDSVTVLHVVTRAGKTETARIDSAAVHEKYGLTPGQLIDLKALMGDASDNIPGVPGVGEKTALDLMGRYGSLDALYAALNESDFKPALFRKLTEGKDSAYLSRDLARIDINAPLDADFDALKIQPPDAAGLRAFYERLAFRKLLQKLPEADGEARIPVVPATTFRFPKVQDISTPEAARELCAALSGDYIVSFAMTNELNALGFYQNGKAYALAYTDGAVRDAFAPFWRSDTPKAGCHVKSALRHIPDINNIVMDVALAAYLLNPAHGRYTLESLVKDGLGVELPGDQQESMLGMVPPGALRQLGCQAAAIDALTALYTEQLNAAGCMALLTDIELPLCHALARMECKGFKLDTVALTAFGGQLSQRIDELSRTIYALAGREFNIQSPKQLGELLFAQFQLPASKKTKTGYSVDAETLGRLRGMHGIIDPVLEYRELCKLKSTYVDGLLSLCGADGRVRTTFQMTGTATGRLSSSEPNLQNIPIRRALGAELRRMFIPARDDWVLVDADYSQIELRVLAHIAGDENMREAFRQGADIHAVTASQVFHVPLAQVTPAMRRSAKAVNFGIVFGISDFSLAGDIGVSRAEAREYMDSYLNNFPGVKRYMEDVVKKAKADGYVTTLLGRRRYLPELGAANHNTRAFGERAALNTPIQGTAADIIKLAMIALDERLADEGLQARLILQVHDELIVECPREEEERVRGIVREAMENVYPLDPPLLADVGSGANWYDAK